MLAKLLVPADGNRVKQIMRRQAELLLLVPERQSTGALLTRVPG
jgi:hypothetical protein